MFTDVYCLGKRQRKMMKGHGMENSCQGKVIGLAKGKKPEAWKKSGSSTDWWCFGNCNPFYTVFFQTRGVTYWCHIVLRNSISGTLSDMPIVLRNVIILRNATSGSLLDKPIVLRNAITPRNAISGTLSDRPNKIRRKWSCNLSAGLPVREVAVV